MVSLVIGLGEIGTAINRVLIEKYSPDKVDSYDISMVGKIFRPDIDILHICIPYSTNFVKIINDYVKEIKPKFTIIHSSVPIGTTTMINGVTFHSPVMGKHPNIYEGVKTYKKFISCEIEDYNKVDKVAKYLSDAGIQIEIICGTANTELMKLLELSRYGVYIAFAKEQEEICKHFGLSFYTVVDKYEKARNEGLDKLGMPSLKQPILYPFKDYVGGHCTVEDMELLLKQKESPLLREAYSNCRGTLIWGNCNIYPTAKIGKGCSIGQFCEIGDNVNIGNNVRIGAFTFIPEGVTIEDNVFIAPKVTFSNDKHPPSNKECWGNITIKKNAVVGMGSIILPCVTVGEGAIIGAGSVVTKDVPPGEVWYGTAAYSHGKREEVYG